MLGEEFNAVKKQAERLAKANKKAEPSIKKIYWFPHKKEVRLVELEDNIPPSGDCAAPYYFGPSPADNLLAPAAIALIRTDEFRKINLPKGWGDWDTAQELKTR